MALVILRENSLLWWFWEKNCVFGGFDRKIVALVVLREKSWLWHRVI
jgi:hypothetical protein